MKLIVGLGNPGEKYADTRHNCGFMVVDHLLKEFGTDKVAWSSNSKLKSDTATFVIETATGEEKVILAKPQTYMNDSGQSVSLLTNFYKIKPEDLWLVYDELDLPLGYLKIRNGGAAAGHHGVESVMESIGTDKFWRFRLGIGKSHDKEHAIGRQTIKDAKEYVLDSFSQTDQGKIRELIKHSSEALETGLKKGIETAMNRFNTK
ncbi:MAG: aminoacyl-tRNA hydrolase [Acidobacteriota bacterium]